LIRPNHCAFVIILLGLTASASSQSIKGWYLVTAPSFGRDSCQPVPNLHQLEAILVSAGWTKGGHLPPIDWSSNIALVTSVDQVSKPGAIAPSQDGSKILIKLDPTVSAERNSGVFLLAIDGQLGSSNACAVYPVGRPTPPNTEASTVSVQKTQTTTSTTRTQSITRTRPE
jgi:hypothetical protein